MKVLVLKGGFSGEREVSLNSGNAIAKALQELGHKVIEFDITHNNISELCNLDFDIAFNALHGTGGEDGAIQGLFSWLNKPLTGSSILSSAITMNKSITKNLLNNLNILFPMEYQNTDQVTKFPVVMKPKSEGSSLMIHICNDNNQLKQTEKEFIDSNIEFMIEEFIGGEEITVGVIGKENNAEVYGVVKIIPKSGNYDYTSKYTIGKTDYEFPAKIDKDIYEKARNIAFTVHKVLKLNGASRSDFKILNNKLYFLEVNTSPGMTATSLLPKSAHIHGLNFNDVVEKILNSTIS